MCSYRGWSWELKRDELASSTNEGMPPEADLSATEDEHSSRSLCGDGDANPLSALSYPPDLFHAKTQDNVLPLTTRAPCSANDLGNSVEKPKHKKNKKRRSALDANQTYIQLTLWDIAVENDGGG